MPLVERLATAVRWRMERALRAISTRVLRPTLRRTTMPSACSRCGAAEAYLLNTPVEPDFEPSAIAADLRPAFFSGHLDAVCANCGLYQAYRRFTAHELEVVNGLGKDVLTTEEAYKDYPVPKEFIDGWYGDSIERQRRRWTKVLGELGLAPRRVLFLRYWFGRAPEMFATEFGAEVYGLDISPVCVRYVREHCPVVRQLQGSINGALKGDFLDGPAFDGVITQHVLVHANNAPQMLRQLRHLVRDGGFLLLNAETKVAPTNPFHKFYPSEYQLASLLREEFDEVYKLDEQGIIAQDDWRKYTGRATEFLGVLRRAA